MSDDDCTFPSTPYIILGVIVVVVVIVTAYSLTSSAIKHAEENQIRLNQEIEPIRELFKKEAANLSTKDNLANIESICDVHFARSELYSVIFSPRLACEDILREDLLNITR